jgi:alpha-mannosidase|tara:strand:- start:3878 stop:4237 length:360 start_codon:yes stop_codon:yes gene_type:complete
MDIYVSSEITDVLEIYSKKFYNAVLDEQEDFYEKYKTMDSNERFNYFIYTILDDNDTFKRYYKLLLNGGCDKKELNKFFYTYMKMREKSILKKFSWAEIDAFNIGFDVDVNCSSDYKFF